MAQRFKMENRDESSGEKKTFLFRFPFYSVCNECSVPELQVKLEKRAIHTPYMQNMQNPLIHAYILFWIGIPFPPT